MFIGVRKVWTLGRPPPLLLVSDRSSSHHQIHSHEKGHPAAYFRRDRISKTAHISITLRSAFSIMTPSLFWDLDHFYNSNIFQFLVCSHFFAGKRLGLVWNLAAREEREQLNIHGQYEAIAPNNITHKASPIHRERYHLVKGVMIPWARFVFGQLLGTTGSMECQAVLPNILFPHYFTLQEAERRVWQAGGSLEKAWRRPRVRGDRGGRGGRRLQCGERPGRGPGAGHWAGGGHFCAQRLQFALCPNQLQAAGSLAPTWQGGRGTNNPLTLVNEQPLLMSLICIESDGISLGNSPVSVIVKKRVFPHFATCTFMLMIASPSESVLPLFHFFATLVNDCHCSTQTLMVLQCAASFLWFTNIFSLF